VIRLFILIYAALAFAHSASAEEIPQEFTPTYGNAVPFPSAIRFCRQFPGQCMPSVTQRRVVVTPEKLAELEEVNTRVGMEIGFVSDWDNYRKHEWWTLPLNGYGDCEDIAIEKRRRLIRLGWPASALLLTVVLDKGSGHAVLTVRTRQGDLILDNLNPRILPWSETGYVYISRQTARDPRQWEWLIEQPVRDKEAHMWIALQ
jgi:predicted transglutaminase-like cysteine proteinase